MMNPEDKTRLLIEQKLSELREIMLHANTNDIAIVVSYVENSDRQGNHTRIYTSGNPACIIASTLLLVLRVEYQHPLFNFIKAYHEFKKKRTMYN